MKAMTKQQLAACAGVSVRTLMNWCGPYKQELARMGATGVKKFFRFKK